MGNFDKRRQDLTAHARRSQPDNGRDARRLRRWHEFVPTLARSQALMTEAAHDADIDPNRLSFIRSLRVIRREAESSADLSPSPNP